MGTIGSVPTVFGSLPNVAEKQGSSCRRLGHYWQVASMAGKVPNVKKPRLKHHATSPYNYITYVSVSKPTPWAVAGPHGQLASV